MHATNSRVRVLGIDLGTTNSTVAEVVRDPVAPGSPDARCIEVSQYTLDGIHTDVLVPSVVAIHDGKVIVGEGAKRLRADSVQQGLSQNESIFFECKNEMGVRRSYHRAPEGFRSAAEIGGHVLEFLKAAAIEEDPATPERIVVTVPASFQAAQRADTLRAAELAGLDMKGGELLDEPVAAFMDYLTTHIAAMFMDLTQPRNLVVFDFGGGTCDVAVFRLDGASDSGGLRIAFLSVSRYYRLGGGDIDAAIVHEVLIPQLISQNQLSPFELDFADKRNVIQPALLGLAETLKIGLCQEVGRLIGFGKYDDIDKSQVVRSYPGAVNCNLRGRELTIDTPKISAQQFEALLQPFLDRDLLFARETEYRTTCSVFAPLKDALERGGLTEDDVDYCLLVGGSSLIPQLRRSVGDFFCRAKLLGYEDRESTQTAIARGAAYHALALAVHGRGVIQPICHEAIAIRTAEGCRELIPRGVALPYPDSRGWSSYEGLTVPQTVIVGDLKLRVEIVASGHEQRLLYSRVWEISGPVEGGESLSLEYRFDENQILELRMRLLSRPDEELQDAVEKPLTNVINPDAKRLAVLELEEALRMGQFPRSEMPAKFVELSNAYAQLGQKEKALAQLKAALKARNGADVDVLNKMADLACQLGDTVGEEKYYRTATEVSDWSGSWFNLALAQRRRGLVGDAADSVDRAMNLDREPAYLVLRAMLADAMGDSRQSHRYLSDALAAFDPMRSLNDWELSWYLKAVRLDGDSESAAAAEHELAKRKQGRGVVSGTDGLLPRDARGRG